MFLYIYYITDTSPCDVNPCKPPGSCMVTEGGQGYICQCPGDVNVQGDTCQCSGAVDVHVHGYTCQCPGNVGVHGESCVEGIARISN